MKRLGMSLAVLVLSLAAQAVCPIPQYEQCRTEDGTNQYLNCLTRNRQEDARFQRCQQQEWREHEQERQERERERQEKEREQREQERERRQQAREKYCRSIPMLLIANERIVSRLANRHFRPNWADVIRRLRQNIGQL